MGIAINGAAITGESDAAITGRHVQGVAMQGRIAYERDEAGEILPTGVTISPSGIQQIQVGNSRQFTATVYPEDATDKTVVWSTLNANVEVTQTGYATRLKTGTSQVRATTVNGIYTTVTIT